MADAEGFCVLGITGPDAIPQAGPHLLQALADGHHGTMNWLEETAQRRRAPQVLWPETKSIVMFGFNYGPESDPLETLARPDVGTISVYARNRDYHDVIKGALKRIGGRFAARAGADIKVFVDTAPVMEKPLAEAAGLGWQGKHTNLVSREHGSWLFLGAMFTNAELPRDEPESDHCGSCRACLDICPTDAFPAPYRLDARRCISYLTIEHKGPIDPELRPKMGNRIYGCDDCLAICPWNKFAEAGHEAKLAARDDLMAPPLAELCRLDDDGFRAFFSGSPIKRIGRDRFVRNVLIAIGNSGDTAFLPDVDRLLGDGSAAVRGMAVWALSRLADPERFRHTAEQEMDRESDNGVKLEWQAAPTGTQ
jgi:epoxyqueuosine reductase